MRTIEYQGRDIKVIEDNALYINAPDMARFFDKTASAWLQTKGAKDFLKTLEQVTGITREQAVKLETLGAGTVKATYMIEPLALEFARYLSLPLYLRLLQISQRSRTKDETEDDTIKKAFNILQQRQKEKDDTIQTQAEQIERLQEQRQKIMTILQL